MKRFRTHLFIMATLAFLAACSAEDEKQAYVPAVASAIESIVYLEVRQGDVALSPKNTLYEGLFSVYGNESKCNLNVDAYKLGDTDVFRFRPDLPNQSAMKYWDTDEGKRGEGYSDAVITVFNEKLPIRFHYRYVALPNAQQMLGGSSIVLEKVEFQGKTIALYQYVKPFKFVLHKREQGYDVYCETIG